MGARMPEVLTHCDLQQASENDCALVYLPLKWNLLNIYPLHEVMRLS